MKPTDSRVSDVLSGLKPQVQSAPFSFEMVSVLFVDVWALPEPELELAPALQPTASRPAAMMTPYVVRRLMPFVLTAVSSVEQRPCRARPMAGPRLEASAASAASAADNRAGQCGVASSAKFVRTV